MVFLLTYALLLSVSAQESSAKGGNFSECISQYRDLEKHILNNSDIAEKLKETFYRTGKYVSTFVYITYSAPIGISPNPNQTNSDTTELDLDDVDTDINCTNHQAVYIWSESPLYLLGPKSLFWFTLFAINVPETSVAIELPCLCADEYYELLSRLTYLVSTLTLNS